MMPENICCLHYVLRNGRATHAVAHPKLRFCDPAHTWQTQRQGAAFVLESGCTSPARNDGIKLKKQGQSRREAWRYSLDTVSNGSKSSTGWWKVAGSRGMRPPLKGFVS
jgi:hypothetical protein